MGYAGTPGMVWGYLIAMFFIQCVALSMAELCSSMPTSGGLYYAAAVSLARLLYIYNLYSHYIGSCTSRTWPFRKLAHGLVQLAGSAHLCSIRKLCRISNDARGGIDRQSELCPPNLSSVVSHGALNAHPRMYWQLTNKVACKY